MEFTIWYVVSLPMILAMLYVRVKSYNNNNGGFSKKLAMPPGPPGSPIFGNLLSLTSGGNINEMLGKFSQKYGPLISLQLGSIRAVVASSPEMAREILKTRDNVLYGRHVPHVNEVHGHDESTLIFSQGGAYWRILRKIATTHLINKKKIGDLKYIRKKVIDRMIHDIRMNCAEEVDMRDISFTCVVNLMSNLLFGDYILDQDSKIFGEFKEALADSLLLHGLPNLSDFFPFLRVFDLQGLKRRSAKAIGILYAVLDRAIREYRESAPEETLLRAALDSTQTQGFTMENVKGFLAEMFVAGTVTTSTTIEWAIAEMVKDRQVLKKCQEELDSVVGRERRVEEGDVDNLVYFKAVMKEVFRMHPPAPMLLPHKASRDTEIGGYFIPKDSPVVVNVWAIGRDESVWKDANRFYPERFLEEEKSIGIGYKGHHFELLPFGSGRRMCVGYPLASKVVHYMLASLLHSFDWSLPENMSSEELNMELEYGSRKAVRLLVVATPRLPTHLL